MAKRQMYSRADELIVYLKKFVKNEFNQMGNVGFDELNVLNAKAKVETIYTRLQAENIKIYRDAAESANKFALMLIELMKEGYPDSSLEGLVGLTTLALSRRIKKRDIDTADVEDYISKNVKSNKSDDSTYGIGSEKWVKNYLGLYNRTTGYLYESEADRKRMRYTEEILTAKEYGDRKAYNDSTNKSANLWYNQSEQYLIGVVDEATIETYKANGVTEVMWLTEQDDRVCKSCKELHGKVYKIGSVPSKPHIRCRCYLIPIGYQDT
jgi:SPP1 gp7 family putative phage head morphogenesis protein